MGFIEVAMLLGGVALFLYGMTAMGDGLKAVAGNKMETYLWKMSSSPMKAFLLGIVVTAVIQSSSATSVMAVSFVNAGMMGFSQAVCIVLGANIGTTMTSWILSLSGAESSLAGDLLSTEMLFSVLVVAGVAMRLIAKKQAYKQVGVILVGLGTILLAMSLIGDAVTPFKENPTFQSLLIRFENPFLGLLAGTLVAAVVQSCSAGVGILQAVSLTCSISYNACLPLILGMNIGASVPVLFSMIGSSKNGKRSAMTYLISNLLGTVIICALYYPLNAIFHFGFMTEAARTNQFGIPVLNTAIRVVTAAVLLPCHKLIEKIIYLCFPYQATEKADEEEIDCLTEGLLNYTPVAIERSRDAVIKMAALAKENLIRAMSLIWHFDRGSYGAVQDKEALVDKYEDKLGNFIVKIGKNALTAEQQANVSCLLSAIGDFERLSDHAANLAEVAQEINEKKIVFSDTAVKEINLMLDAVTEIVELSYTAFVDNRIDEAKKIDPLEEVIDELCKKLRAHHIERLQKSDCTILMGFVFNDLLTNLERVSDHCSNIAFSVLHSYNVNAEGHEYAEHLSLSPVFQEGIHFYREKYLSHAEETAPTSSSEEAPAVIH